MFPDQEQINLMKNFLVQALDPFLIILFGSAAAGQLRKDSDFDIAFLSDREVGSYQLFTLAQQLADLLGREVHLIDLNTTSTVLQAQIVGKGKVIFDKEPNRRQEFFILVLKKYARLNEEREPILARIKERGTVFIQ